jgi:hypothetical protein
MHTTMTRLINAPSDMPTADAVAVAELHTDGALHAFLCWNDREYACGHESGEFDTPDRPALIDMVVTALTGVPYGVCAS